MTGTRPDQVAEWDGSRDTPSNPPREELPPVPR
jgi:hypothetical protein